MFLIPVPHSHHSGNLVTARVSGGGQALSWHGSRRHAWKAEARYSAGVAHDGGGQARVGGRCSGKVLTHELSRKRRHRAHGWKQENTPTPIYSFLPSSRKSKTRFLKEETVSPSLLINTHATSSKCLRGKSNKC